MLGLQLGELQLQSESSGGDLESVFARAGVTYRLALGAELARIKSAGFDDDLRALTITAHLDILDTARWMPIVLAGAGFDWGDAGQDGHHVEVGAGLEYRGDSGLVLGADLRVGDRAVPGPAELLPIDALELRGGDYASGRLYAGIHF